MMNSLLTLCIAICGWWVAKKLKLPAPAMLGSMIAVSFANLISDTMYLPMSIKVFTQAISGAYIAAQITRADICNIRNLVKPIVILMIMFTINTFVMGILIHFVCDIDITTALLSCVAGGVSDISLIAMDMNVDVGTVAMMQTSRLICVLLFFPYWIRYMTRHEGCESDEATSFLHQTTSLSSKASISKVIVTMLISIWFGYLGNNSGIPAGAMIFPMVVIVICNCTTSIVTIPLPLKDIAQLLAGALIGTSISSSTFKDIQSTIVPVVLLLISYWIVNYAYAYISKKRNFLDLKSALFASAPGGATDMTLIAADLHADLTKIAVIQLARLFYAIAIAPLLIVWFVYLVI